MYSRMYAIRVINILTPLVSSAKQIDGLVCARDTVERLKYNFECRALVQRRHDHRSHHKLATRLRLQARLAGKCWKLGDVRERRTLQTN